MKSLTSFLLGGCFALLLATVAILAPGTAPLTLGSANANSFSLFQTVTSSTVSNTLSNTPLLSASNRSYAIICNQSTSTVWLSDSTSTLVLGQGIPVTSSSTDAPHSCYEIASQNLFKGAIYGRAAGTTTVSIVEAR